MAGKLFYSPESVIEAYQKYHLAQSQSDMQGYVSFHPSNIDFFAQKA